MAQQTGIVIFALSQLNRSGVDKHPQMTELRESGQIEQDADLILLMHKGDQIPNYNGYYDGKFQTTIIIEKNKEGMTGKVPFIFNGVTQQFFLNTEEYDYE
jgi:Replicative DNA helicase